MENDTDGIEMLAQTNNEQAILKLLKSGLDPNLKEGRLMRLAARHGAYSIVNMLLEWGGNLNIPDSSGATPLQLAVFSGLHWNEGCWEFLLSHCDSTQLADAAAVAIVFNKTSALKQILRTGRCYIDKPTSLTGRTVEMLAKLYKLEHIVQEELTPFQNDKTQYLSPAQFNSKMGASPSKNMLYGQNRRLSPEDISTNQPLSPSVAHFFEQTARQQSNLSPQNSPIVPVNTVRPAFTTFSPANNQLFINSLNPAYDLGHNWNPPQNVVTNNVSPAHNVMMNHFSPMHNVMNKLSPSQNVVTNNVSPAHNVMMNNFSPMHNVINKLSPSQNVVMNNVSPAHNLMMNNFISAPNIMMNNFSPTHNVMMNN